MEEWIGLQWHRFVTTRAEGEASPHEVRLVDVRAAMTLLLHAGGAPQRVAVAAPVAVGGQRGFWQRVAGTGRRRALAQIDDEVLAVPERVAVFADAALNRDLYLWWAALAACIDRRQPWLEANLRAGALALERFPGLARRWRRLNAAEQRLRGEAAPGSAEACVQRALAGREQAGTETPGVAAVAPVWTWLVTHPPGAGDAAPGSGAAADAGRNAGGTGTTLPERRRVRRAPAEERRTPLLLAPKGEGLRTFGDPMAMDRGHDDEDDGDARVAAEELENITLQRDGGATAARVRFDLDLPSASADDVPLGPGERLPEWDLRSQALRDARVHVQPLLARDIVAWEPGAALRATAARVRRRMELQRAAPRWRRGVIEGEALDLDAWVRTLGEPAHARRGEPPVYQRRERGQRELATLLLADLSLSTDAYANDEQRVIDVIRDALYVFGEALAASGDAFAMHGFSSVRRELRLHRLKAFGERWGERPLARLGALRPGYYTRMGAALRAATRRLETRPERQRLLLLLTDGKPHDLDGYDGRLGFEDTRQAVLEARRAGLLPFALSIDAEAGEVMPRLFGHQGWAWVRRPEELPQKLAALYGQLTR